MHLFEIDPFKLQPNPWNSNKVARGEFEKLKASLSKHGAFKPVVVRELEDGSLQIIGGYHRNEAAKELGWTAVPVVNLGSITDEHAKEIGIIDNTRYGEDDKELLEKLMEELADVGLDEVLPDIDIPDLSEEEEDMLAGLDEETGESEKDESHKTLKLKFEIDKAEEIEAILLRVADEHDYKYRDGYSNLADALYHILVIERS